ncbi:hypothetical protein [Flavobacterium hungaricum]|uniref:EF-hand domain-containing protein n=1 Tax=Flavobacterium hungaricum TaxID=2082725 RepID=A0ABR9TF62_9FLAO|nr:hypothetical protein [Flavobacterium hungaricum]MBE8723989.1 hypothetical protein [Flavobacterium hungaricum]
MIKNWKKNNEKGVSIAVDILNPHLFNFDKIDKEVQNAFLKGKKFGISWEYNGNEVHIFDKDGSVEGFPLSNLQYVAAIFKNSNLYSSPNNGVLFNLDGSVHKILELPKFKSDFVHEIIEKENVKNLLLKEFLEQPKLSFEKYSRYISNQNSELDIFDINYNNEITESQILDLETLEFTDFLKTRFDRNYYWNPKWKKENFG